PERALQIRDRKFRNARLITARDAIKRATQLHARDLKFEEEIVEVLVAEFFQVERFDLVPKLDGRLKATVLKRMTQVAIFGTDPIDPFAVGIRLGLRLVQRF